MPIASDADNPDRPARVESAPVTRRGGLGRGLGSLIPTTPHQDALAATTTAPVDAIEPNPYQPRAIIDDARLKELVGSVRAHGVIQPIIVARSETANRFTIIAGERRWRAARLAGLATVPIVVKEAAPQAMLELALIENVVRADLSPLEEAAAYRQLIDEFGLTQATVAERVGRSRVSITNTLRLLSAPERVQAALTAGTISEGHARALLGLGAAADQLAMLQQVIDRNLNVRQTEDAVRRWLERDAVERSAPLEAKDDARDQVERQLRAALGTRVDYRRRRRGGGSLTIHFHSDEELNELYDRLVGDDPW
jgi:ParB family chromosome partitioning protein